MAITKITDPSSVPVTVADYEAQNELIKTALTGLAKITLSNYDNDSAPAVKVGSIFDVGGTTYIVSTADETPTGYSGISVSTTFYLYYDVSAGEFVYSETTPVWNDAYQDWYNGDDRAFFSMYKDSGGTLYQSKGALLAQNAIPPFGGIGSLITAASSDWAVDTNYLPGTTVSGSSLYASNSEASNIVSSFGIGNYDDFYVNSGNWDSLNLTGTWRLLSRAYRGSGNTNLYPIGLFQRIS